VFAVPTFIRRINNRYHVTSEKIVITEGSLKKHQRILALEKQQNMKLTQ
jgi:membrane protein YdbS with pleckstrin-like domain